MTVIELLTQQIDQRNQADAVAIADLMFADGEAVRLVQHLENVSRSNDVAQLIRALFASIHEAIRIGALAGIEHGIETTHDARRVERPKRN